MTIITQQAGLRILVDPNDRSRADGPIVTSKMTAEDIQKYGGIVGQGKRPVMLDAGLQIQERTQKPKGMVRIKMLTKELLQQEIKTKSPQQIAEEYGYLVNSVKASMTRWGIKR